MVILLLAVSQCMLAPAIVATDAAAGAVGGNQQLLLRCTADCSATLLALPFTYC
jgi:hypothetical protein